jgi:single-strand DNA-binding protein
MSNMQNRATLIGYAANDPEVRSFESGRSNAKLKVATHDRYKNAEGEWTDETQFHTVLFWGKLGDYVGAQIKKGDALALSGKLIHRTYTDAQDIKRYSAEIVADEVQTFKKPTPEVH